VVVVDVDLERYGVEKRTVIRAQAALVRGVDGDKHALAYVVRQTPLEVAELHEPVLVRQRHVAEEVHDGVLAEPAERERRRHERAERISVRVFMGRDEEPLVGPERVDDLSQLSLRFVRLERAHR
jgi:hypothetical protein